MDYTLYSAHRLVWVLSNKTDLSTDLVVDHIDRDIYNNSPNNLRATSQSTNCKNKIHKTSNTGLKYIYENNNGFNVKIKINGVYEVKCFYYGVRFQKRFNLTFEEAREVALKDAIAFRDKYIEHDSMI